MVDGTTRSDVSMELETIYVFKHLFSFRFLMTYKQWNIDQWPAKTLNLTHTRTLLYLKYVLPHHFMSPQSLLRNVIMVCEIFSKWGEVKIQQNPWTEQDGWRTVARIIHTCKNVLFYFIGIVGDRWSSSFTIEIVKVLQFEQSLSDFYGPSPSTKNDFQYLFTQNIKIIAWICSLDWYCFVLFLVTKFFLLLLGIFYFYFCC